MAEVVSPFDAAMQHWLPVRVYYEDTDFTGMVYHANYLRFFERGRSEFLRDAGVSHQSLLALPEPAAFTLTNVQVDYKRAARIDDALMICSRYIGIKGAKVLFEQTARRGDEVIAEALITAIMIHADGRPRRPIPHVVDQLRPYIFKS
ncbi:YbgC/FadM family acyl-CoA thioesterase [Henriciella marina]|uniref:YbgC/FadM family acyl-CoA thioesterase n=1 Tax=Henriciella marina TaxID=453851 RepID=UPI0022B15B97|nr:YbgC/FadM family acyl-CoA thioesterase [Henriciella marina]